MYTCYLINPYWDYHCCAMIENYIAKKLAVLANLYVCNVLLIEHCRASATGGPLGHCH